MEPLLIRGAQMLQTVVGGRLETDAGTPVTGSVAVVNGPSASRRKVSIAIFVRFRYAHQC